MYITDDTYTKKQVLRMEHLVLKVLNFDLAVPSALTFANLFCRMSESEERTAHLAQYLCELTLMDGETYLVRSQSGEPPFCLEGFPPARRPASSCLS